MQLLGLQVVAHPVAGSVTAMADPEHPDWQLLLRIAESGARDAMEAFYARHVRYLFAVVQKQCASLGFESSEVEDLVQDTFARAFERASTFKRSDSEDPERSRRWTRAWLGTIVRNLLLARLRAPSEVPASDMMDAVAERDSEPPRSNRRLKALSRAISALSDREQDILRVTAMYYRAGERHQRLPNDVSSELARRWGTTNENIRAIRSRALKRVTALTAELLQEEASHV